MFFLDPYKDPEVEEWAARKIQRSFKDFKTQKSRTNLNKSDTETMWTWPFCEIYVYVEFFEDLIIFFNLSLMHSVKHIRMQQCYLFKWFTSKNIFDLEHFTSDVRTNLF